MDRISPLYSIQNLNMPVIQPVLYILIKSVFVSYLNLIKLISYNSLVMRVGFSPDETFSLPEFCFYVLEKLKKKLLHATNRIQLLIHGS